VFRVSLPMWSCSRCVPTRKCGGELRPQEGAGGAVRGVPPPPQGGGGIATIGGFGRRVAGVSGAYGRKTPMFGL